MNIKRLTKIYDNGFVTLDAAQFAPIAQETMDRNICAFEPFEATVRRLAEYEDALEQGKGDHTMTNYERIKNMNTEEMALWFHNTVDCDRCVHCNTITCEHFQCEDGIKEWLESEVEK